MRTTVFTVASVSACFGIVAACTHDFDTFSGTADEGGTASSSSGSGSSTSGGTTSTSGGGSTSGGSTSGGSTSGGTSGFDSSVDCQMISGSCYQQGATCNNKCATDHQTCTDACPNGNQGKQCRANCDATQTTCLGSCKTTCQQCAGPQCSNKCP